MENESKYRKYLNELIEFQNQGEKLDIDKLELWKKEVLEELPTSYKIKFSKLQFYSIIDVLEDGKYYDDDLPF